MRAWRGQAGWTKSTRGGGGRGAFVRFWVAEVELTVGPYWLLAPNG